MPQKKRKTSKKRRKKIIKNDFIDKNVVQSRTPTEPCIPNQYDDNISLYERENVDLLETVDGIEYDGDQFRLDFPHLAAELQDADLIYPMDAVRWDTKECVEEDIRPPEEPTLDSLLRRSKTEEEAIEIIEYFEKRGEVNHPKATKLISKIKSKGLETLQRKKGKI
ncbi:MAG: DUF2095 family protein [Candidatus Helarchaeota archaeon]|nr:DUF2095 family protein [Candidatus Helarchaeota archaeon]